MIFTRPDARRGGLETWHGRDDVTLATDNRQAAAPFGALRRKGPDDRVSARLHGLDEARDIRHAVAFLSKEVKRCSAVPDVVGLPVRLPLRHVGDNPLDLVSPAAEVGLGGALSHLSRFRLVDQRGGIAIRCQH